MIVLVAGLGFSAGALATDFPIVGVQAPAFDLPDLSGIVHSLSDYSGHPIVINFWTTWCGACTYEFPVLETFQQDYHGQVTLITICAGKSREEAVAAVKKKGVDFLVLYDDGETVSKAYQPPRPHDKRRIVAFPFSVFIDKTGKVVYARVGTFTDIDKMISLLQKAGVTLAAPSPLPAEGVQSIGHGEKANGG